MKKKLLLSLLCGSIFLGLATGCGVASDDDSKKYNINIDADEKIEVKTYVDYEKDYLIVYLKNNNSYNIGSFDVSAIFYDGDGNKIGEDSSSNLDFMNNSNYVVLMYLPEDNNYVPEKIDLSVKVDREYQDIVGNEKLYNNKILTSYKTVGDEIEVKLVNDSNVDLSTVEVVVLFMKNGKAIYADNLYTNLDNGETETETIDIPEDWEASENSDEDVLIDFDSIEIVVNRANDE